MAINQYSEFRDLFRSMRKTNQEIDRFRFLFKNIVFDVIVRIDKDPFQVLVGSVGHNWSCLLICRRGFVIEMDDKSFYSLCELLQLAPGSRSFTSAMFIRCMAENCPKQCSGVLVDPLYLKRYEHYQHFDEREKESHHYKVWVRRGLTTRKDNREIAAAEEYR